MPRRIRLNLACRLFVIGLLSALGSIANGQLQIRDLTKPFVVLDTEGHSAAVRSLIFDEPGRLVSGGFDKVVHTWDFADGRPTLASTIRPASWRGLAGVIYAMALSPKDKGPRQRLLAIGGLGLWSSRGNITLYKYPPTPEHPLGEVVGILPAFDKSKPNSFGHKNTVMSLAFSPDGTILASASNDGRVILWDYEAKRPIFTLAPPLAPPGPTNPKPVLPPINAVAFSPDGLKLVAAGVDGIVRIWDVKKGTLLKQSEPLTTKDEDGRTILSLAYSPSGRWIVIGTEGGQVARFEAGNLKSVVGLIPPQEITGPIDAIAISPDGTKVAASVVDYRMKNRAELARVESHVQVWSLDDGRKLNHRFHANNMIYALAFSPDSATLAFSGGDRQAIEIHDLKVPDEPSLVLQGLGESVWRVGFLDDSRTVGFSHAKDSAGVNVEYIGFNLKTQSLSPIDSSKLQRALATWNEWRVEPVDPYLLRVFGPKNRTFDVVLSRTLDRRWWKWSFIPPSKTHPEGLLAVAHEAGVHIYRLDNGLRTRSLAGHYTPVYDLAPSADGMWLATGSSDQTVRIWSLAGLDTLPPLGATFRKREGGKTEVSAIEARGFAEGMGLKVGDVVQMVAVEGSLLPSIENLDALDRLSPPTRIEFRVTRGQEVVDVGTTRRESPVMSLFVGADREWVVWTPEGYYQTSVSGDRKYLGWQKNGKDLDSPVDRFPAETFEKELRRPDVLTALIETDNPVLAAGLVVNQNSDPSAIVENEAPPTITMTPNAIRPPEGPVLAPQQGLVVDAQIEAEGRSPIVSIRTVVDGLQVGEETKYVEPQDKAKLKTEIPLHPGINKVVTIVTNKDGKQRTSSMEVISPVEVPKAPKLHILAVGASGPFRAASFPKIPHAAEDARDLRKFFEAPGGKKRFQELGNLPTLVDSDANGKTLIQEFQAISEKVKDRNDALVVVLETHMLTGQKSNFVIAVDTTEKPKPGETPTAEQIADTLADVASRGCKVLLILDTSHEKAPKECREGLTDYVRSLSKRGVITFVAANHGYSRPVNTGRGAFAEAILGVFKARTLSRPKLKPGAPMTLDDFQDAVVSQVLRLTRQQQFASCYIPTTISSSSLIFDPNNPN